ncbi:MAG: hypothetical protein IJ187_06840 [Neisseriaceae bacterium]|nr:hypothetical protein [Neisseriaceae bacterium]
MKILRKKSLIILLPVIVMIGVVVAYQFYHSPKQGEVKTLTDEEIRQKYIEILSCTPEQSIDKKIIFAEAMKQYWQYRMDELWKHDEEINDLYSFPNKLRTVENHCGLEFDVFGNPLSITKETCYPWIVPYKNTNELYQALLTHSMPVRYNSQNAFRYRMYSLSAKTYKPKINDNIYIGEQNFSIIKREGWGNTYFYPEDCCRLVFYKDIKEQINNLKQYDYFPDIMKSFSIELLNKIYFLEIRRNPIDLVKYDASFEGLGERLSGSNLDKHDFFETVNHVYYLYYPVSLCGKGVFLPYSLQ